MCPWGGTFHDQSIRCSPIECAIATWFWSDLINYMSAGLFKNGTFTFDPIISHRKYTEKQKWNICEWRLVVSSACMIYSSCSVFNAMTSMASLRKSAFIISRLLTVLLSRGYNTKVCSWKDSPPCKRTVIGHCYGGGVIESCLSPGSVTIAPNARACNCRHLHVHHRPQMSFLVKTPVSIIVIVGG